MIFAMFFFQHSSFNLGVYAFFHWQRHGGRFCCCLFVDALFLPSFHTFLFLLPVQLVYCLFLVAKPIEWPNRCLYLSVGVHCGTQVESTQQIAMVQSNFKTFTTLIITG